MSGISEQLKVYDLHNPGTIFVCDKQNYWLKPEQNNSFHLDEMLINIFDGSLVHISSVNALKVTALNEICF